MSYAYLGGGRHVPNNTTAWQPWTDWDGVIHYPNGTRSNRRQSYNSSSSSNSTPQYIQKLQRLIDAGRHNVRTNRRILDVLRKHHREFRVNVSQKKHPEAKKMLSNVISRNKQRWRTKKPTATGLKSNNALESFERNLKTLGGDTVPRRRSLWGFVGYRPPKTPRV